MHKMEFLRTPLQTEHVYIEVFLLQFSCQCKSLLCLFHIHFQTFFCQIFFSIMCMSYFFLSAISNQRLIINVRNFITPPSFATFIISSINTTNKKKITNEPWWTSNFTANFLIVYHRYLQMLHYFCISAIANIFFCTFFLLNAWDMIKYF